MRSNGLEWAEALVAGVERELRTLAVLEDATPMAAYMRQQFAFMGVRSAGQKAALRAALTEVGPPRHEGEVVSAVDRLWHRPEREYRYTGCALAGSWATTASPTFVAHVGRWIATDSWWDTCDPLARRSVGTIVLRHASLRPTMDAWLAGQDRWLARAALIHMGGWKGEIDRAWVFAACLSRSDDPDFFIRKAIGWILRDLARVDPGAVVSFVEGRGRALSGLSRREALKNVAGPA